MIDSISDDITFLEAMIELKKQYLHIKKKTADWVVQKKNMRINIWHGKKPEKHMRTQVTDMWRLRRQYLRRD